MRVEQPIVTSVLHDSASAIHWRSLIVVEEGAEVTLAEQWASSADDLEGYFNPVTELIVGDGANVEYLCVQDLSERAWILGSQRAQVGANANLHWVGLGLGSGQGKLRMETDINGAGATARVTGAYAGHGKQHLDYETTQEHAAPHTVSDLAFRGVLRDRATAVWSGMIKVDPGAQRTDAFQESRNLLLDRRRPRGRDPRASRSRPTTCAARTRRPSPAWTTCRSSISRPAGSRAKRRSACWWEASSR